MKRRLESISKTARSPGGKEPVGPKRRGVLGYQRWLGGPATRQIGPAAFFGFALILALLLASPLGCSGKGASKSSNNPSESKKAKVARPSDEGKKWDGWRWKGKRDDCFFMVKNKCHSKLEDACKAAGCAKTANNSQCLYDGSAPAKVSCKK